MCEKSLYLVVKGRVEFIWLCLLWNRVSLLQNCEFPCDFSMNLRISRFLRLADSRRKKDNLRVGVSALKLKKVENREKWKNQSGLSWKIKRPGDNFSFVSFETNTFSVSPRIFLRGDTQKLAVLCDTFYATLKWWIFITQFSKNRKNLRLIVV